MNIIRYTFVFLIISATIFPAISQGDSDVSKIEAIFSELEKEDQQKILDYANLLLQKSKESPEEKEIRLYKADNVIPTEETSNKIMEFSRYMMSVQKTTEDKIEAEGKPLTSITFDTNEFKFDKAKEGDVLEHTFNFVNTGKNPLFIYEVKTSCGCTIPEWTKEAVLPGKKGTIKIAFNTASKKGKQVKLITVLSNTEPKETALFVKGFIE